jgi:NADH dehydrogenase
LWAGRVIGAVVRDVVITRDEIEGLMAELLYVEAPPAGSTRLSEWVEENRHTLGTRYASELRRRDRARAAPAAPRRSQA